MINIYVYADKWECRSGSAHSYNHAWLDSLDVPTRHRKVRAHMRELHRGATYRLVKP